MCDRGKEHSRAHVIWLRGAGSEERMESMPERYLILERLSTGGVDGGSAVSHRAVLEPVDPATDRDQIEGGA